MLTSIVTEDGTVTIDVPRMEIARMLASIRGFLVDVEPMAGHVVIRASDGAGATFSVKGDDIHDASEKLIKRLVGQ